jgi:1-acyl-sn-glycerol-3-phosphate acyltransferase
MLSYYIIEKNRAIFHAIVKRKWPCYHTTEKMILIIKVIYSAIFLAYMVTALVVIGGGALFLSLFTKDRPEFLFIASQLWSKYIILPFSARVKIRGLENIPKGKPVIFVSNHQSYLDIPIMLGYLPGSFRFIVKREYFKIPILGIYTKLSGHLSINRQSGPDALKTLQDATNIVKAGKSIIIFPEGTRSLDGKLGRFKRGGFALAFEAGVPIIPMAISGGYKVLRSGTLLLSPGRINLKIGKPINLKAGKPNKEIYLKTVEFVRDQIEKMLVSKEE